MLVISIGGLWLLNPVDKEPDARGADQAVGADPDGFPSGMEDRYVREEIDSITGCGNVGGIKHVRDVGTPRMGSRASQRRSVVRSLVEDIRSVFAGEDFSGLVVVL